jgi:hypothetical protein
MDYPTAKGADAAPGDRVRALCRWKYPAAEMISQKWLRPNAKGDARAVADEFGVGPDAVMIDRGANRIVLVAHAAWTGAATEEVAHRWTSQFAWWQGSIDIVTAFGHREEFALLPHLPAWGSYAWFEAEPEHVMRFGESMAKCGPCPA